jgi:hypothetical protein
VPGRVGLQLPFKPSRLSVGAELSLEAVQLGRRRFHVAGLQRFERARPSMTVQDLPHHLMELPDGHPLGGERHHDPGQARARLPQLERVHGLPTRREVLGQLVEAEGTAQARRIGAELRSEQGIEHQPLDQLADPGILIIG